MSEKSNVVMVEGPDEALRCNRVRVGEMRGGCGCCRATQRSGVLKSLCSFILYVSQSIVLFPGTRAAQVVRYIQVM